MPWFLNNFKDKHLTITRNNYNYFAKKLIHKIYDQIWFKNEKKIKMLNKFDLKKRPSS